MDRRSKLVRFYDILTLIPILAFVIIPEELHLICTDFTVTDEVFNEQKNDSLVITTSDIILCGYLITICTFNLAEGQIQLLSIVQ